MKDKNGNNLSVGDYVMVPPPSGSDQWNFDFEGIIIEFREDDAVVEDSDGDCWCVESNRLEISN